MAERSFGPVVVRRRLGSELRRLRGEAGMSLEQAARGLEVSPSKLSRLENGESPPKLWDVRNLLTLYGVEDDDYRRRAERWVNEGKSEGWWHPFSDASPSDLDHYISLESEAGEIRTFCSQLLQGLLQTEGYARAVLSAVLPSLSPSELEGLVSVRMRRQRALEDRSDNVKISVVIDELVLRRPIGGPEVMREQLRRLVELAQSMELQVRPLSAPFHLAMLAPFTIFVPRLIDIDPIVVNVESAFHDAYWEEAEGVTKFVTAFTEIQSSSLSPEGSVELMLHLIDAPGYPER